jgi:hypothetical protein
MQRTKLIFVLACITLLTQSCLTKCEDGQLTAYKWTRLALQNGYIESGENGYFFIPANDSVRLDELLVINVMMEQEEIAKPVSLLPGDSTECSGEDYKAQVQNTMRMFVYTMEDFNDQYPANSDITALCSEITYDSLTQKEVFMPLDPTIDTGKDADIGHIEKKLHMADSLATNPIRRFKIKVIYNDSSVVTTETVPVVRY